MIRTMLVYGAIVGAIVIATIVIGYAVSSGEGFGASQLMGYLIMLLAVSLIFIAIKQYRDKTLGGVISFWTAAKLGVGISVVAGLVYVAGWEAHLAATDYAFIDQYTETVLEQQKAKGATPEALAAQRVKMEAMKENYAKPLYRMPITFLEIFPVGFLVALVSAALLRNEKFLPMR